MFSQIILLVFVLIGLALVFFAHKIGLWWGNTYVKIMKRLGIGEEVPWVRVSWPLSIPVSTWILRILGAIVIVASAYTLYMLIFV